MVQTNNVMSWAWIGKIKHFDHFISKSTLRMPRKCGVMTFGRSIRWYVPGGAYFEMIRTVPWTLTIMNNNTIISYNCRGFKNGTPYIKYLLTICDILFVQETWLLPTELHLLNDVSSEFSVHAKSAMGDAVQAGILRGRPYGVRLFSTARISAMMSKLSTAIQIG